MGNFKRDNRFSGRENSRGFSGRDSGGPTMHGATCDECGKKCEVPFKPRSDKPIFCNDCFRSKGNTEPRRFGGRSSGGRSSGGRNSGGRNSGGRSSGRFGSSDTKMYEAVCDKCGENCEVPFKPTSGKPIYCRQCFDQGGKGKGSDQTGKQFEIINTKLDKILGLLNPASSTEKKEKKKTIKKTKVAKPKKVSKGKVEKAVAPKKVKVKKKLTNEQKELIVEKMKKFQ